MTSPTTTTLCHVIQIILQMWSIDLSLVTLAFPFKKLSQPQFFKYLTKKTFFEVYLWFKFNNLGLALGMALKFYTGLAKRLPQKARKFWGLILTFVEVRKTGMGKNLHGEPFCPPFWIGLISVAISQFFILTAEVKCLSEHQLMKKIQKLKHNHW